MEALGDTVPEKLEYVALGVHCSRVAILERRTKFADDRVDVLLLE